MGDRSRCRGSIRQPSGVRGPERQMYVASSGLDRLEPFATQRVRGAGRSRDFGCQLHKRSARDLWGHRHTHPFQVFLLGGWWIICVARRKGVAQPGERPRTTSASAVWIRAGVGALTRSPAMDGLGQAAAARYSLMSPPSTICRHRATGFEPTPMAETALGVGGRCRRDRCGRCSL